MLFSLEALLQSPALAVIVPPWVAAGAWAVLAGVVVWGFWRWRRGRRLARSRGPEAGPEREPLLSDSSASPGHLAMMLDHTEALLWEAEVVRRADGFQWEFRMQPSRLTRRLFPRLGDGSRISLWRDLNVPEWAEMNQRSRDALNHKAPGYEQEFRVPRGGEVIWIRETVSIQPRDAERFWLVGLAMDISHQREAELARRQSERSVAEILERSDCLLWRARVREVDGRRSWLHFEIPNSGLYPRLFGDRPSSMGSKLWSLISVPRLEEMNARCDHALSTGAPGYRQEFEAINNLGERFWLHEETSIDRVAEGEWHLVGVVTDVTGRRRAEDRVRAEVERFQSLFEHMPAALVEADMTAVGEWLQELRAAGVVDLDAHLLANPREFVRGARRIRVINGNEAAKRLTGADDQRDLRWRRHLFETPSALDELRRTFVALAQGQNQMEAEVDIRRVDGAVRRTAMRWWVARNPEGLDLSRALLVWVDVTEWRKAEAELAVQRERLAITLRSMTEGVITADADGRVRYLNPAAAALCGLPEEAAIGRALAEVFAAADERTGRSALPDLSEFDRTRAELNLPSGTVLPDQGAGRRLIEGRLAPMRAADERLAGVVLVFRDITDRDRLEKELVRATRLESVGVLAGGIAHDFNNILTVIGGNVGLARMDVPEESPAAPGLRDAERAVQRARELTQQLLTFAKGGEPVRAAVNMAEVIREMVDFALHGANVRADFDLAPDLWLANADRGQVSRVVHNLVLNAVQAMPEGGTVRIVARNTTVGRGEPDGPPVGRHLCIEVIDTGAGIRAEHLPRIFDPYFTTKETGTGLGLAAAYSIVRKHGGSIAATSRPGEGTTFRVWLPAASASAEPVPGAAPTGLKPLRGRVLVMDDEADIRVFAVALLQRLGLEAVAVADGQALLDAYMAARQQGKPFQVVVTDLTVPGGMGGLAALEKLKAIDTAAKVVVSSGYSSDPVLADHRRYGFCGVVAKPYQPDEMRRVLAAVLTMD